MLNKKRKSVSTAVGRAVETLESRQLMSATLTLDHSLMVFNAVKSTASPIETLTLTNTGDADVTFGGGAITVVNDPSFATQDATRFTIVNGASIPATLSPGQSFALQLKYTAPSSATRNAALLDVSSNDPSHPLQQVEIHGISAASTSGTGQPSLARILRAWDIPTIVGEGVNDSAEATDAIYPTPPDASSQEVVLQRLVKAGTGPVTIQVLASYTASGSRPYTLGTYTPGNPDSLQELFYTPSSEFQSVFVHPQGATNFDPGSAAFGFYFVSNVQVKNRVGYSEDALNTWDQTVPRKFRFFPMENPNGSVVPNAYVMTSTEWDAPIGYDFTNIVAVVRNVMPAPSAPTAPSLSTLDANALPGSNTMIFNRIQNPNATLGDQVHDTGTLHVYNSGGTDLVINSIQLSSAWTLVNPPTFPLTIAAGATTDLTIKFIATSEPSHPYNETNSPSFPNGGGVYSGTLKINSNDPNNPTQTIKLAGWWQQNSENSNEPSLQSMMNLLIGWGTNINASPIPNLTEGATPTYYGEEVVSPYWRAADTGQVVTITQLDGFHTEGNVASTFWFSQGSTTKKTLFTTGADYGQTLFPQKNTSPPTPAIATFSPGTGVFGFNIDGESSDDTKNNSSGGYHVRFYPVRDATGALVPNTYIIGMDYAVAGSQNFDFQDNTFLVQNIRPSAVPPPPIDLHAVADSSGNVSLQWAANGGSPSGYNIYRSLAPSSGFALLTSGVTATSYTDATAPAGTAVYYKVTQVDSSSVESLGPVAGATTSGTPTTGLQSLDIGATPAGSTTVVTPGTAFTVVAGGPGVAGTSDGFRFLFQQQSGDFDVRMQVSSLTVAGNFSTAGLMARGTLNTNSANVYMSASPANFRFKTRATAGATEAVTATANGTTHYPNVWVRLRRVGNVFTGFTSTDGMNWTTMSSATVSLPSTVFLGPAVASNVTTSTTTAQLSNFGVSFTGPVANADSFNATTAQPALLNILQNDTDSTGTVDPTTVTITSGPNQGGTATVDPVTGRITYTSAGGFFGTETFTYTVRDNNGLTSPAATVTVIVAPTGPSANPDSFNAIAGKSVQVNVLANDTDSTGTLDPTTVTITQQPNQGGTVSVDPVTGMVTYTAAAGFSGTETFAYTVTDSNSLTSAPATVTFTVTNSPSGPLANDDTVTATAGQSVQINVLANDTDASGSINATTVTLVDPPDHGGTVQIDPTTGLVTYTPAVDFSGIETFTYTVNDGNGTTSNTATVTANVAPAVVAPVANDDASTALLGTAVQINVAANDTSDAGIDATTVAVGTAPAHGTATVNSDGTITFTPAAGFLGRDTFTYTVKDVNGVESNAASVTLNVGVALSSAIGGNRLLSFTDADGTTALMTLNHGVANVFFSGNGSATTVRGRVTIAGTTAATGIVLTGTNAASVLVIRGTGGDGLVTIPAISDTGAMGAVLAPSANLTGTANFGGLSVLQVSRATGANITIGTFGPVGPAIVAGAVSDSSLTSGATIRAMRVTSWTDSASTSTINAPAINSLLALGDFNASLGLTGALGAARVVGAIAGGSWNVLGNTNAIVAGSIASGWDGTFDGKIGAMLVQHGGLASRLSAAGGIRAITIVGDLTGNLTVGSLTGLRVTGGITGSAITVVGTTPVSAIVVGGAVSNATITTAGDLLALVAGSLAGSTVTAGVDAGTTLDNVTSTNIGTHSVRALRLTGRAADAFADSSVIAHTILSSVVGDVNTANSGTREGLAAVKFGAIALTANGVKAQLGPAQLTDATTLQSALSQKGISLGDFVIDIVT